MSGTSHNTVFTHPPFALEKWESPDGRTYYHFNGMGGNEWAVKD